MIGKPLKERIDLHYQVGKKYRQLFEKRWKLSVASEQGLFLIPTRSDTFIPFYKVLERNPKRVEFRKLISVNLLQRVYDRYLQGLLNIPLNFSCIPATIQQEDIISARVASKIINGVITPKLQEVLYDLFWWMLWVDTTLLKVGWNEKAGEPILIPEITYNEKEGEPYIVDTPFGKLHLKDAKGKKLYHKKVGDKFSFIKVPVGDLVFRVIPPFNYYVDPNAKGINALIDKNSPTRVKWIIIEELWDEDILKEKGYKVEGETLNKQAIDEIYKPFLDIIGISVADFPKQNFYLYREYYEIPNASFPDGLFVKMIGDKIMEVNPLPEPFRKMEVLPFIDFRDTPRSLQFFGRTTLFEVRELNRLYNQIFSKIVENIEKIGKKTAFMEARGGEIKVHDAKDSEMISEVVDTPGGGPQPFITELDTIPLNLLRALEIPLIAMEYITGMFEIKYPLRERTATEIMQMVATSEQALDPLRKMVLNRLIKACEYGLEVIKEFYPPGRKIEIGGGEYGLIETMIFDREDLRGKWNIQYTFGDFSMMAKTNRLLLLKELLQIPGMIQVLQPETILGILNMTEFVETLDTQLDVERQRSENLSMQYLPDYVPKVEEFDNHLVHIKEIDKFLKLNYERLDAFTVQKFINHRREHQEYIFKQMQNIQSLMKEKEEKGKEESSVGEPAKEIEPTELRNIEEEIGGEEWQNFGYKKP